MKILSIDLGDAHTGIAMCDNDQMLAYPLEVINESGWNKLCKRIAVIVKENGISQIVLGYPLNTDGTVGERANKSELFKSHLSNFTDIPIELFDERLTTVVAHEIMSQTNTKYSKRMKNVDKLAATLILECYLNYKKREL